MALAENRERIEELEERVDEIEELLDRLTDDVLEDLAAIDAKTDTMMEIQELVNPDAVERAREERREEDGQ